MKKYELTKEHEALLPKYADKWIKNAMSTKQMDQTELEVCTQAVKGLYEAASLTPPNPENIVFVESPFVLRFASGFAAAILYMKENNYKEFNLNVAPNGRRVRDLVLSATLRAVTGKSYDSADISFLPATKSKLSDKSYAFNIQDMIELSNSLGLKKFGLECANKSYNLWQGGNQWSAWASFINFFKEVAKLDIDYSKWNHYELLAIHSGPRCVHKSFCMISDRPSVLTVDAQNRPHNETGPFCEWRDGSKIYALNGVYVPQWLIETPKHLIDAKKVLALANTEQRMAAMKYVGNAYFLKELKAEQIDEMVVNIPSRTIELLAPSSNSEDVDYRFLSETEIKNVPHKENKYILYYLTIENVKVGPYLYMECPSSGRKFLEGVGDASKYETIDPTIKTVSDALKFRAEKASKNFMTKFGMDWEHRS